MPSRSLLDEKVSTHGCDVVVLDHKRHPAAMRTDQNETSLEWNSDAVVPTEVFTVPDERCQDLLERHLPRWLRSKHHLPVQREADGRRLGGYDPRFRQCHAAQRPAETLLDELLAQCCRTPIFLS